ncbi:hypothetical protein ECC02_003375 [Trypanosoma cruzi]|uniref:N-terminal region of Chorein, a TM vesicle-mediated sorter family protein n=1 Tax=Trypanosoma cruzi TaxID=5693 RepID=A0A7J6YAQ6_TRYCR|nr:hypothetical protein ECC02_003375 [Trypanosoma cruzi]
MLEKYLSAILVPYFSKYAENIDSKQLNVDLWSGKASLNDLILRPSILDALLQGESGSDVPTSSGVASTPSCSSSSAAVHTTAASTAVSSCLPLTLQRGVCKKVSIVVPFTQLRSKPVVVEVDELFICVCGSTESRDAVLGKAAKLDAQAAHKARELEQFEAERRRMRDVAAAAAAAKEGGTNTAAASPSGLAGTRSGHGSGFMADAGDGVAPAPSLLTPLTTGRDGYFSHLGELVVNNIVVKVRSVHVRYEDESTKSVMGVILGGVEFTTIDSITGEATFIDPSGLSRMHKRLEFKGMQFYCDDPLRYEREPGDYFISKMTDMSEWHTAMRNRVEAGDVEMSTVLGPVKGHVDVNLVFKKFIKNLLHDPYLTARMKLGSVTAKFNRAQYVSLMRTVSLLSNWTGGVELFPRRPTVPILQDPAVWWRYAIRAVKTITGAPRRERLLQRISEVCIVDYHVLYRDVVRKAEMSADKQRAYRFITRFMTVPDMIAGRKYVYTQIANAIQLKRKDNEAKKAEAQSNFAKKNTGWFAWLRRGPKTPQDIEEEEAAFEELERSYGINPNDPEGAETTMVDVSALPKSYCWLDAQFDLPMFSLRLDMGKRETVTLMLHSVRTHLRKFNAANSVQLRFITENLTLSNPVQDNALQERLPSLVEGIPLSSSAASAWKIDPTSRRSSSMSSSLPPLSPKQQGGVPLLECSAAFNPIDAQKEPQLKNTQLDFALDLRLLPLRIVAEPSIIDHVICFFQFPKGLDLASIVRSTKSLAATVGQAASSELRRAMAHSKSFSISVDAAAPYIIVPKTLRGSVEEPALAVSLGHVQFETEPLTETEKQSRLASTTTLSEMNEDLMYYSSSATFSNFYVEIAPIGLSLERPGKGFMLVPEVAFSAKVLQIIDDSIENRERFIVRMEVPSLCMACSVSQAYILSNMVESWLLYLQANDSPYADEQLPPSLEATLRGGERASQSAVGGLEGPHGFTHTNNALMRNRKGGESESDDIPASPSPLGRSREDLPYVRLHLKVKELGILIYEDEPETLQPMKTPRFTMAFSTAEVTLHVRTLQKCVSMILEQPYCSDAKEPDQLILSATVIRCGVKTAPDTPIRVDVELEPSLRFCFGTPCIQLLETLMDIMNLVSGAPRVLKEGKGEEKAFSSQLLRHFTGSTAPRGTTTIRPTSQHSQVNLVEELCSTYDTNVVKLSLHVAGTTVVDIMDRRRKKRVPRKDDSDAESGEEKKTAEERVENEKNDKEEGEKEEEDYPFAHASFTEMTLSLKKNGATLEVSGGVGQVTFALAEAHDVAPAHRTIVQYKAPPSRTPLRPALQQDVPFLDTHLVRHESHEHINFSYRTSLPVVPIFETDCKGKRHLSNAAELRFSSFVEIEVSSSTVLLDVYSILTVTQYFSSGLFARVTQLTSRPRYDGRVTVSSPPVQPPTLLTSLRVYARDLFFILPIDTRTTGDGYFQVTVDHVVVQSSLLSAEGKQTMNISLREIRLLHTSLKEFAAVTTGSEGENEEPHTLMPTTTLDMSVKTPLDPLSDEPLHVDLRGEDVTLQITETDIVGLCRLASGNLRRMPPPPSVRAAASAPKSPQLVESSLAPSISPSSSTTHMPERPADISFVASASGLTLLPIPRAVPPYMDKENTGREVRVLWRASKVCLNLLDESTNKMRFRVEGNGFIFQVFVPSNDVTVGWESLELNDVYEVTQRASMMLCGESRVELRNILTSSEILQKNFGMRSSVTQTSDRSVWDLWSGRVSGTEGYSVDIETELLEVPTVVVDFTLKRFALSDQWLAVHDFVCNEAVMAALRPMMGAAEASPSSSLPLSPVGNDAEAKRRFHCLIKTRTVNVPFLTTSREEFIEADITSLFVDFLALPGVSNVTVRMQDLEVRHRASAERILYRQSDAAPNAGGSQEELLRPVTDAAPIPGVAFSGSVEGEASAAEKASGGDILAFSGSFDAGAERQKVTVSLGQLTALFSMPLIMQLVEYCTRPDQPIAKISNLGVMRERREWLARAAEDLVQSGAFSLSLLWRQPRIILAGDAQDLGNKLRSIEAQLGIMRSTVSLDKRNGNYTVAMKVTDMAIPDMLEKSSLRLSYALKDRRENVDVVLDKTAALLHPEELEKLLWVLHRNLMAPTTTISAQRDRAGMKTEASSEAPVSPKKKEEKEEENGEVQEGVTHVEEANLRTIHFRAEGVVLAIHDVVGINAHTAFLSGIDVEVASSGDVRMTVGSLTMLEHFTNRQLAQSLGDQPITVYMSSAEKTVNVTLADMRFMLIPKALGSIFNTLLSVQFPPPLEEILVIETGTELSPMDTHGKFSVITATEAPTTESQTMTEPSSTVLSRCILVSLNHCSAVAVLGSRDVCVAELKDFIVDWRAYTDASMRLTASIEQVIVRDTFSTSTLYPEILQPLLEGATDTKGQTPSGVIEFSFISLPHKNLNSKKKISSSGHIGEGDADRSVPSYTYQLHCQISSFAIVLVPEVTSAVVRLLSEVKEHISDVNREKAYDYVADKTVQTVQERQELTQVELTLHRSSIILVDSANSSKTMEMCPGDFLVRNEICCHRSDESTPLADSYAEVFRLHINRMSLNVLGAPAFSHNSVIEINVLRGIGENSASSFMELTSSAELSSPDTTSVSLVIPTLSAHLTRGQLECLLDVMGAWRNSGLSGIPVEGVPVMASSTLQAAGGGSGGGGHPEGAASGATPIATSLLGTMVMKKKSNSGNSALLHSGNTANVTPLSPDTLTPSNRARSGSGRGGATGGSITFKANMQRFEANIDGVFQLDVDQLDFVYLTNSGMNTTATTIALDTIALRHHVCGVSGLRADIHLFVMKKAQLTSTVTVQMSLAARMSETNTNITLDSLQMSLSPLVLLDAREMLYGPFCTKVLRLPLSPIPVCRLTTDVHVLGSDLVLDSHHIIITAGKTRCSYKLDLNQHKLYLSGTPTAQIVLDDNCQLTLTNGCIFVPGMYALSSFVSFGLNATLFTTDTCIIEKQVHHGRNLAPFVKPSKRRSKAVPDSYLLSGNKNAVPCSLPSIKPLPQSGVLSPPIAVITPVHAGSPSNSTSNFMGDDVRTIASFQCKEFTMRMLSEEVEEISVTVTASTSFLYLQQTENGVLTQRSANISLKDMHTSEEDENTLFPTTLELSLAGADTICIVANLSGLELCLRMALLRSLLEFGNDFMTAFIGEAMLQRHAPQVALENEDLQPLVDLPVAGECLSCGSPGASLGESKDATGVLCYHCCTGRRTLPATEINFDVPLVDLVLLGGQGGMLQLYTSSGIAVTVAPDKEFQLQMKLQVYNLNPHANIWEPLVERFEAGISGNVTSSTYKIKVDRFDYVFSPDNMKLLSQLAADFSPTSKLHKQLRKKLRNNVRKVLTGEKPLEDGMGGDTLRSMMNIQQVSLVQSPHYNEDDKICAFVVVTNYLNESLEVDGKTVEPRGGRLEFAATSRSGVVRRCGVVGDGMTIHWAKSPLYVRGHDMLAEVRLELSRGEEDFRLHCAVRLHCYPVHRSNMIICFENNISAFVEVVRGLPAVSPHERFYFHSSFSLDEKLYLRPVRLSDGEEYTAAVTKQTNVTPTLRMLLNASFITLVCRGSKNTHNDFIFRMKEQQDGVRAGIPTFLISIEPQLYIQNCLPYDVFFSIGGSGSKKQQRYCAVVESAQKADVVLGDVGIDELALHLELQQNHPSTGGITTTYRTQRGISLSRGFTRVTLTAASKETQEMRIHVQCMGNIILLGTPYSIVNFTPLDLQVWESNSLGELVSKTRTNFGILPKKMQRTYAASPSGKDTTEFFVNISVGDMWASAVPFHVQGRGLITMTERNVAVSRVGTRSVFHFVYLTQVDMYGTRFVTIVPRWILVNCTSRSLYIAQALKQSASAPGATTTASSSSSSTTAAVAGGGVGVGESSGGMSSRSSGDYKNWSARLRKSGTLLSPIPTLSGEGSLYACSKEIMQLAPANSATPFFSTLNSTPDVGYGAFLLQDTHAPIRGDPVSLEEISSTLVVVHGAGDTPDMDGSDRIVEVSVATQGPYTFVTMQDPVVPPYILINRTEKTLDLCDTQDRFLAQVKPGCVKPFAMDVRNGNSRTRVSFARDFAATCFVGRKSILAAVTSPVGTAEAKTTMEIDKKGEEETSSFVEFNFQRRMTPQEASNPLGIEYNLSLGPFGQQIVEIVYSTGSTERALHKYQPSPPSPLDVVLNINMLSISMVMTDRDVLFGAIVDTRVHFNREGKKEVFDFSIKNFQVDNQTEIKPFFEVAVVAIRTSPDVACLSGHVERIVVPAKAILYLNEVRLDVVPVALRISDNVLVALAAFGAQLSTELPSRQTSPTEEELFDKAQSTVSAMDTRVIMERMVVNPLVVRLWFEREVDGHDFIREHIQIRTAALVSMLVRSCEDVRIATPGIAVRKRSSSAGLMLKWLIQVYLDGIRNEIHGILFQYASSLPLLGVPIKLVSGIGSGAMKFFQEPIAGLSTSPKAFAMGFASGSSALVTEVMGGGLGAVSNLAKTGADIMGAASGGRQRKRTSLLHGITSGVTGVLTKPMEGVAESGATGLVRGVGMGLIGVVTRPMAGLLSDVSKVTGAVAQLCDESYIPDVRRLRKLREFHAMGAVAEYESVLSVYEYERGEHDGLRWKGNTFIPTDGPQWYPCTKEQAERTRGVSSSKWSLEMADTNFEGWRFSTKYYGVYTREQVPTARVRRRRWVAVLRSPLTSRVVRLVQRGAATVSDSHAAGGDESRRGGDTTTNTAPTRSSTGAANVLPAIQGPRSASGAAVSHETSTPTAAPVTEGQQQETLPEVSMLPRETSSSNEQVVELYEYESKLPLIGWGSRFLPAGCSHWQYRDGRAAPRKSDFQLRQGWVWASAWALASAGRSGVASSSAPPDGWEYVQRENTSSLPTLRRRCWRRTARRVQ